MGSSVKLACSVQQ